MAGGRGECRVWHRFNFVIMWFLSVLFACVIGAQSIDVPSRDVTYPAILSEVFERIFPFLGVQALNVHFEHVAQDDALAMQKKRQGTVSSARAFC